MHDCKRAGKENIYVVQSNFFPVLFSQTQFLLIVLFASKILAKVSWNLAGLADSCVREKLCI